MIPETHHTPTEPVGERLLFIIAFAIFAVVAAEATFVAIGGTVLMVATVFLSLIVAGGVIYAVGKTIDSEDHE